MATQSLDAFPAGSRVTIKKLCDCPKTRNRLCSLGLTPGAKVEMCGVLGGGCRIKVRGTDIVLAEGLACSVYGSDNDGASYVVECEQRATQQDCGHERKKNGCIGRWRWRHGSEAQADSDT